MTNFSDADIQQIKNHGLTVETVQQQLRDFASGFPCADIVRPAVINDGVLASPDGAYAQYYRDNKDKYKIVKFVPASGAATRMFKDLFNYLSTGQMNNTTRKTLDNLEKFAFYDELKQTLPINATGTDIIKHIVSDCGLNYGALPKALLKFHKYPNNDNRTALSEHLIEGAQYAESNGTVNIHFTVSPEHRTGFEKLLAQIVPEYEQKFNVKYNISMSSQMPQTDTIAVNPDNTPFRSDNGELLFRPAGHGALIENLNNIDADLIFIKNIDNICTDATRDITVYNKELIAGIAIKTQEKIFQYMSALDKGTADTAEIAEFINKNLGTHIADSDICADKLRAILNRPLRVCGIIKNTGEAGGGPFWVHDTDRTQSLQIVEPAQIAPENIEILTHGEFFNPTDLVCATRDWRGNKFDLLKYVDTRAGFISEKSSNGRPLRAMERPGLWNGAMAGWNTVFVAVPLDTFTPAKVVTDLISAPHLYK